MFDITSKELSDKHVESDKHMESDKHHGKRYTCGKR